MAASRRSRLPATHRVRALRLYASLLFGLIAIPADFGQTPAPVPGADLDALRLDAFNNGGNPKRGEALFFNESVTHCSTCHKARGRGGEVGPDLSQISGKFDRVHLVEPVLEPSAQILEGYRTTTLSLASGQVVSGIVNEETADSITLAGSTGQRWTVRKADVKERRLDRVSLISDGFGRSLSPAEFTDLIAFLGTLRTGRKPTPGEGITGTLELPAGFLSKVIAQELSGCTALAVAADGRAFVCEQTGALRVVKGDRPLQEPFFRLPVGRTWERGLIGVTVDPTFPNVPHVCVCYIAANPYPHHVISRFAANGDVAEPGSEKVLFEGDDQRKLGGNVPAGHQGGATLFGKDGKLCVAVGEQTAETPAQDLHSRLGKMLRLNPDGSFPGDDPFVDNTEGKYRAIWALGLRNPFTFAVQPGTGRMFINDVGGRVEEVNEGVAGANYGWPTVDHGPTTDPRFRGPVHYYPAASITGGAFSPADLPWPRKYRGRYFSADFVHGWIRTLNPEKPAVAAPFATGLRRPVDIGFGPDGRLYVLCRDAWVIDKEFKPGTGD